MEAGSAGNSSGEALDTAVGTALFSVKEEPLDFDLMVKVEDDLELDLPTADVEKTMAIQAPSKTESTTVTAATAAAVPQIGSSNSAFQPYKCLTILTNLQRGNVKTTNKENAPESLTFHEKAAKASLTDTEITESTVHAKDPNDYTPLHWAAFHGRIAIVQKLIEKGADVNCDGKLMATPLIFAACNGHTEVINYLLSKGAAVDKDDCDGNTPLMFAVNGNHIESVVQLLKSGASMSTANAIGDTPFEIAISKGHLAVQYAMEDFLREEIEMSISMLSSDSAQQATKHSSNLNNSNCNTSSSSSTISNGTCNNNSGNSIVLITNCNGSVMDSLLENGEVVSTNDSVASNNHLK